MCKIVTPVVTVFDEKEKPDYEGNKKVIDFLIEGALMEFLCWDRPVNLQDLRNRRNMISSNSMQIILQGAQSFMLEPEALILKILWRCQMK